MPAEVLEDPKEIVFPDPSLVCLIGPSGSGKTTFAERWFLPTEVVSSDRCRALVCDDEASLTASSAAFDVFHLLIRRRLDMPRFTVADSTSVEAWARRDLIRHAKDKFVDAIAVVFDFPNEIYQANNSARPMRHVPADVIDEQERNMRSGMESLRKEGFRSVVRFTSPAAVSHCVIRRRPLRSRRWMHLEGPFDVVGDVHGCLEELQDLLQELGWKLPQGPDEQLSHPDGRMLVFVGDLVDRGPDVAGVLRFVMAAVESGVALCVPGNHDWRLTRSLAGFNVSTNSGLATSLQQLMHEPEEFHGEVRRFIENLPSHLVLAQGQLVVAHAGLAERYHGRSCGAVLGLCLYGVTTGQEDEFGLPVRIDWALNYQGQADVVYGHTPHTRPEWRNRTINIDTGCVFGGTLTALRWPERELVSVPARRLHAVPARPLGDLPLVPPAVVD